MSDPAVRDLLDLLAIAGPPGDEGGVADHLRNLLITIGVPADCILLDNAHRQSEYGGACGNLIVRLDGNGRGERRLFSAHMDTVPGCVGAEPILQGDKVINAAKDKALGGDNRTGCACLLQVARTLLDRKGDHAPTTLVFFVQEEVGLVGSRGLDVSKLGEPKPTMGFNFDGYHADRFLTAVTGTQRFTIDIAGIAAHSGMNPEEGVSAALIAAGALAELERTGWHGVVTKPEGVGRANVGTMRGGTGSNVVMPALHILAEARSHDPRFRAAIIAAWKDAFQRSVMQRRNHEGSTGTVTFGPGPTYEAYALPDDAPVVSMALAAAERIGMKPQLISDYGGNDANWLAGHGIPAITIGCGQRHVHMPAEEIDLGDFRRACDLARALSSPLAA